MPGIKELKTRIRSIGSTRKITRAMQMVSAAKMRKAQNATLASRTYSSLSWELILNLTASSGVIARRSATDDEAIQSDEKIASDALAMTKLLQTFPEAKKIGVVLLTTNRGLVGSLNTNLMTKLREVENPSVSPLLQRGEEESSPSLQKRGQGGVHEVIAEIIAYGKTAKTLAGRMGKNIVADFTKLDRTISTQDIFPLAQYVTDIYKTGKYQKIVIVYNHFVSTLVQKPTIKQLLPFSSNPSAPQMHSGHLPSKGEKTAKSLSPSEERAGERLQSTSYLFEPSPAEVLEHLLPRIIESQIYQTILESDASEHSARMVMMKNATEAAGDLISDLTLTYNQLRQNKITTELAEITAGKIALE